MKQDKDQKEHLPEFLLKLQEEEPFQIPEGYFQQLRQDTWEQLQNQSSSLPGSHVVVRDLKGGKLRSLGWGIAAVAACLAILLMVYPWNQTFIEQTVVGADLTEEEILEYIEVNIDEFNESDLVEADLLQADLLIQNDLFLDASEDAVDGILEELLDEVDVETIDNVL